MKTYTFWARLVLAPVALIGAVLSFRSLYEAALPTFGPHLSAGFPLLVDLLILGASLQYVAGAKVGRPMAGWRWTAHAGVAATLLLNALAADNAANVPWHVTAPAVWAVLVELTARTVLGEWRRANDVPLDRIPASLWLTAPVESARSRLLMLRTARTDAPASRVEVGVQAAAREALRLALPGRDGRRVRQIIHRQLRAGSLPPSAVLRPLGWDGSEPSGTGPARILQMVLQDVLTDAPAVPLPEPKPAPKVPVLRASLGPQPSHPLLNPFLALGPDPSTSAVQAMVLQETQRTIEPGAARALKARLTAKLSTLD
jgi:hypothetical protein